MSLKPTKPGPLPHEYLVCFNCPTLVNEQGAIIEKTGFAALIRFPKDYLRCVPNPAQLVALLSPQNTYHPNVAPPFLCLGNISPGTSLCELVFQIFEILTFQKLTPNEQALSTLKPAHGHEIT